MSDNAKREPFLKTALEYVTEFVVHNGFPFVIVFLYLLLYNKEIHFFPDVFQIQSFQAKDFFYIIISTTASIFGIVVTVVLLTFELSKRTLFKRVGGNVLNSPVVRNFIFLGVTTILLSIASYIIIRDFNNGRRVTVAYYIGCLFTVFVIGIYPVMKRILYSTSGLRTAMRLIERLKLKDFDASYFDNNSVSLWEGQTPLFVIKAELISAVRENDFETYNLILNGLNARVMDLMGEGDDREMLSRVQSGLVSIWKAGNFEAIRVGSNQYFDSLWESILAIYVNAIDQKHRFLHYQQIEFFMQFDFITFLGRNDLHDNLSTGAKTLSNIFRLSLDGNCPQQAQLIELYKTFKKEGGQYSSDASLQWEAIFSLIRLIFDIQQKAIENADRTLYENCEREISVLLTRIYSNEFSNLGELQQAYLIIRIVGEQIFSADDALKSNLFDRRTNPFRLEKYMLEPAIKDQKIYVKRVMTLIGGFIINSQRQGKLYSIGLLHDWGTLSRLMSRYYSNSETTQKAINYIIRTLEVMKSIIEKTQLPNEADNYNEIKEIMTSLRETLIKDNGDVARSDVKKLDKAIASFKKVKKEADFVPWQ